jgi:hypothetical protein
VPLPPPSLCTVVHATAIFAILGEGKEWVTMPPRHPPPRCRHRHLHMSKRGMANNAKAPSSVPPPPPPSLLRTFVRAAATIAIMQEGEELPMMPTWHCLLLYCCSSALPLLLPLRKQARDGQRWSQGTIFCSATIVVAHHHPCCCHQSHCRSKQGVAKDAKAPSPVLASVDTWILHKK